MDFLQNECNSPNILCAHTHAHSYRSYTWIATPNMLVRAGAVRESYQTIDEAKTLQVVFFE